MWQKLKLTHFEIFHVHEIQSLTIDLNIPFFFTFTSGLLRNHLGLCGAEVSAFAVIIPVLWYASDTG